MATMEIDGGTIHYELLGDGPPVVLTPGGRHSMEAVRELALLLAPSYRVLLWDRRNTGVSSMYIGGDSEPEIWTADLAQLLTRLDLAPAYLGGASAGCRMSLLAAIRHPELVKGLFVWLPTGGPFAAQFLGFEYHVPFVFAAERGGMERVVKTRYRVGQLARSPEDEKRLLTMDPDEFIAVLKRWNANFYRWPERPLIDHTEDELRSITVPTLIFRGNDDSHPPSVSDAAHRLIRGSELVETPWTEREYMAIFSGRVAGDLGSLYTRLAPTILDFLGRCEAGQ